MTGFFCGDSIDRMGSRMLKAAAVHGFFGFPAFRRGLLSGIVPLLARAGRLQSLRAILVPVSVRQRPGPRR